MSSFILFCLTDSCVINFKLDSANIQLSLLDKNQYNQMPEYITSFTSGCKVPPFSAPTRHKAQHVIDKSLLTPFWCHKAHNNMINNCSNRLAIPESPGSLKHYSMDHTLYIHNHFTWFPHQSNFVS